MIKYIISFLTISFFLGCSSKKDTVVNYSNPEIVYSGRIDSTQVKGVELYWPGTSLKLNFEGESISVLIEDERGDNYYNVIIDDNEPFIFRPDTSKNYHQLASGLSSGQHSIELFRRTEWGKGKTTFYGFKLGGNGKTLPKPTPPKRKIEFYGNSITAAYAIEDFSGKDSPDSTFTNNYLSYAALTSRHFEADYQCICASGTGLTVSWHPIIMPELYDRLNPKDSRSKWDFSTFQPDIVVVNLFQNDTWLVNLPDNNQFKKRFGTEKPSEEFLISAYADFISNLRNYYPKANIICSLGCMDASKEGSVWRSYIESAVRKLADEKVYTHFLPYIEASAHPSIADHETMANSLSKFIEENIDW